MRFSKLPGRGAIKHTDLIEMHRVRNPDCTNTQLKDWNAPAWLFLANNAQQQDDGLTNG